MPNCFVVMPISTPADLVAAYGGDEDHFRHVLRDLLAPAVKQAGFDVIPPAVDNSEVIQAEIIKNLAVADLVLCDMSTLNPNVFFELGIRVALDRPVAMIRDDLTAVIPFDNAIVGCHTYSWAPWNVRAEIPKLSRFLRRTATQQRNAMWQHFGPKDHPAVTTSDKRAPVDTSPPDEDFDAAVDRLLDAGGMKTRRWTYDLRSDGRQRTVWLTLRTPPSEFLEDVLRKEAARLGLTLHLSRRPAP